MSSSLVVALVLVALLLPAVLAFHNDAWDAMSKDEDNKYLATNSEVGKIAAKYFRAFRSQMLAAGHWDQIEGASAHDAPAFQPHECDHDVHMRSTGLEERFEREARERREFEFAERQESSGTRRDKRIDLSTFEPIRVGIDDSRIRSPAANDAAATCAGTSSYEDSSGLHPCRASDQLTSQMRTFLTNQLIPALVELAESILAVQPLRNGVEPSRPGSCSFQVPIPSSSASGLASSDFWVIFTARPIFANGQDSQTVATALPCDTVPNNGRPSIGYINFNPQQFQELPNNEAKFQAVLRVGFHEMTHALGFTSSLYDDYRDSRTNNLAVWPPGIVTVTRSTPWGPRPVCETPRVQAFARQHYGCATLTGVGFETEGGPGTELSHWKQRQTGEEYMGGFISPTMYISNLTLALFEDMGWYRSNYSFAEDLPWLRGAGCTATTERCTSQNWPYFCSQVGGEGCTPDRRFIGTCNVVSYAQNLPAQFQYLSQPNLGGALITADYCPFVQSSPGRSCADTSAAPPLDTEGEIYGPASRCFSNDNGVGCYQVLCAANRQSYQVQAFDDDFKDCPPGSSVDFSSQDLFGALRSTTIQCPPVEEVCAGEVCVSVADGCVEDVGSGSNPINWLNITDNALEFWLVVGIIIVAIACCVILALCCLCDCLQCLCPHGKSARKGAGGRPRRAPHSPTALYISRTVRGRPPASGGY